MTSFPSIFLSHGAPDLPLTDHPAKRFLQSLPSLVGRPTAILMISAHWACRKPTLMASETPQTVHDFAGWDRGLYQLAYPARTDGGLVSRIQTLLENSGLEVETDQRRGFDHGAWVPLLIGWPDADIPVVQLSLDRRGDTEAHFRLGQALEPLRAEGVLVIGSGATVHNLYTMAPEGAPVPDWAREFDHWLEQNFAERKLDTLLRFPAEPATALYAHPTIEHLLPLYVAMGAGWSGGVSQRLHHSYSYGSIGMSCFAFGAHEDLPGHLFNKNS